ncbi:chloroplastic import inner membrane translocase subunit HP30-1-like [Hibiscus syriacus]|uniref:chloroplastic import inner membrane translocase subunit HP30-1-like n=1 Tax=Hibiscus syriacus TaxID=106335 RepID=UPI0019206E65|nr:chloroplastic import inner membrane translocase subunit HP30-1-like [Hibiscus syriacus]
MERGKEQGMVVMPQQNPLEQLQAKFKEVDNTFRGWLAKQSLPVEAAVVTTTSAAQGAAIGAFMGTLTNDVSSSLPTPQASLDLLSPKPHRPQSDHSVLFSRR